MNRDTLNLDRAIEQAVDRAMPLFMMYGWTYYTDKLPPTRDKLAETIRELIGYCDEALAEDLDKENVEIQTGRFCVEAHRDGDVDIKLELSSYHSQE